ncbi:zinc finger protein ZAT5 [Salvia miltiorrhiza]|uniref:zinc finger protein ZAT5 n=1 Tax=Salvia miltiorrhiza TaxID=226208 RepID=UPI0025AD4A81|nr:zinc finger protein ZAT5 [Salvia miltiorrhiza]
METVEEEVVVAPPCHNNDLSPVAKGKRTKRQRPHSPIPFTVNNHRLSPSFSAASAADSTTTEEEDTARCLILLSRGHFLPIQKSHHDHPQQYHSKPTKPTADRGGGAAAAGGGGMYACKTCNRVFSSFQALGGHRTSHKKPKNDKKTASFPDFDDDFPSPPSTSKKRIPPSLSLQLSSTAGGGGRQLPSPRVHECSYCGAEFASGQALGGHMRRHRAGPASPLPEPKKPRNGLSLDLNFPAPEDESQRFGYGGGSARREKSPEKMVISTAAPALVDCHY